MPRSLHAAALALTLVLAAGLRFWGLGWGAPDAAHPDYSYHPDEALPVGWARLLEQGQYIAKQFQYGGTLHFRMLGLYDDLGAVLAPVLKGASPLANTILAGRGVVAAVSLLTILLLYQAGRLLFDRNVGLLAALLLAVTPVHAFLAKNLRPDEVSAFIAVALLYVSARIHRADRARDLGLFIGAGFVIGVALALRFPLAAFGLGPIAARILREPPANARAFAAQVLDRSVFAMAGMILVGYAVGSPHSLLHGSDLARGIALTWQYESGVFVDAVERGPGLYQYGWLMMREAFGLPLALLMLGGVVVAGERRARPQLLLLTMIVPYFILTSFASWVVVRYLLPIAPLLALLAASAVMGLLAPAEPALRKLGATALAAVLAWTLMADFAFARMQGGENVRDTVTRALAGQAQPGCAVLTVWQYEGDVYLNPVVPESCQHYVLNTKSGSDAASLLKRGFDFVVLNESLYLNAERLGPRHPSPPVYAVYEAVMQTGYELQAEYKAPAKLLGIDFSGEFRSQDYAIVNPGIRVYRRALQAPERAAPVLQ